MSRRVVWTTTLAVLAIVGLAGAAGAQYAGNGYPDNYDYGPDFRYDRGGVNDPYGYPAPPPNYRQPQSYNYEQDERLGPQYADPPQPAGGERERSGGAVGDEALGESINEHTRVEVPNSTGQPPGTIIVNTGERYLYLTERNGQALRYGIGVGREGFAWKGTAQIKRKAEWPGWTPPSDMLKRRPDLPRHMTGGIDNPLGARAMYLYNGKGDTGFRIHGTNEPDTIGKAVSSGCIRMMNGDVIDLFTRVPVGTKVVVL